MDLVHVYRDNNVFLVGGSLYFQAKHNLIQRGISLQVFIVSSTIRVERGWEDRLVIYHLIVVATEYILVVFEYKGRVPMGGT